MSALPIIQGTTEWLEARSRCITATDIAAILGLHPYKSPAMVYLDKTGQARAFDPNEAMKTGTHLEPSIAAWWGIKHEKKPIHADFALHGEEPIFGASPDYLVDQNAVLECKWCGQHAAQGFGEGPDDVPTHYLLQVQWQLFVTGRKTGYLCVLGPWGFRDYTIHADSELHRRMAHQARIFWHEYVMAELAPPLSGSYGDKKLIEELHPADDGQIIAASYELEDEIAELGKELIQIAEIERSAEGRKNRIKQFMGDAATLESVEGKFNWKSTKDRTEVDWQAAFNELYTKYADASTPGQIIAPTEFVAANSTTKPGYRRFTTPWRTEKA